VGGGGPRERQRLDQLLVQRGLAESRNQAQRLIMSGEVRVDGETAARPAQLVPEEARLEVQAALPYVSRGGTKLEAALTAFGISVQGKICADIGASTGGFTDCLLQRGAARVYAIDVGHGILHYRLRQDPRVVPLEETNARYLERLPEPVELVSIDAAFISLRLLLPPASGWLRTGGDVVALVKPQFEAGRVAVGRGGVIRDSRIHREVLERVVAYAVDAGLGPQAVIRSPLRGPKGNVEFLLWAKKGAAGEPLEEQIERSVGAVSPEPSTISKNRPESSAGSDAEEKGGVSRPKAER
jgi:23S rRNA (cytidine1920-2'-O)/16S rRNA (cytidine1409-2'-O)-methyltransferase